MILTVSAHCEEDCATITVGPQTDLIYDYYGFPAEACQIEYTAPGHPQSVEETVELIKAVGIQAALDRYIGDLITETLI